MQHRRPKQNTRELLQCLDEKVSASQNQLRYLTSEMSVNGAKGLQAILKDSHEEVKQIKGSVADIGKKVDVLWTMSEKVRTRTEAVRVIKRYVEARPWLQTIVKGVIGKLVKRIVYTAAGILLGLLGIDQLVHLGEKIISIFSH